MKGKRILSGLVASAMLIAGMQSMVLAEGESAQERILSAVSASELDMVLTNLTADEQTEVGLDVTNYNALAYSEYAAKEILAEGYTDFDGFKTAFDAVMPEMMYREVIDNFSIGVSYNATGVVQNGSIPIGLKFRSSNLPNGNYGTSSYLIYEVDNPMMIVDITADITTSHAGTATNSRDGYFTGYTFTKPPVTASVNAEFADTSNEFLAWKAYVENDFTAFDTPILYKVANGSNQCDGVQLGGAAEALNMITADTTPFVIQTSKPEGYGTGNQNINVMELTVTYDKTKSLKYYDDLANEILSEKIMLCKGDPDAIKSVLSALTDEEVAIISDDINGFKLLAYPIYAAKEISAAEWSDLDEFRAVLSDVMSEMIYTEVIDNFSVGVSYNDTGAALNNNSIPEGLHFRSGNVPNGHYGSSSYLIYEVANPFMITNITADITGSHKGSTTGAGRRAGYLSGYSLTQPPVIVAANQKYDTETQEFKEWKVYVENNFTDFEEPALYDFEAESYQCNGVNVSEAVNGLNNLETDTAVFVVRASDGVSNQNINVMKLTVAYDETIYLNNIEAEAELIKNSILLCKDDAEALSDTLLNLTSDEEATVSLNLAGFKSLKYPIHAAEVITEAEWTTFDEFANVFEAVMSEMIYTEKIETFDVAATYNNTGTAQNNNTIALGVSFRATNHPTGFYGTPSYFMYTLNNPSAITGITADITGNSTGTATNSRTSYLTAVSMVKMPTTSGNITDTTSDAFALWTDYVENKFTDFITPVKVTFADGSKVCNAVDLNECVNVMQGVESDETYFVLEASNASANQGFNIIALTVAYDKTVIIENADNAEMAVVNAVNSITDSTTDNAVFEIITTYGEDIVVDETAAAKFAALANSVKVAIFRDLAKAQCADSEALQAKAAELIAAAEDVDVKYQITAIPFANYTDCGADIDGDGNFDTHVGWMREITVKKLTNNTDSFVIVLAAYKNGALTNVSFINDDNCPTNSGFEYNYNTLKNAADGAEQNIYIGNFYTVYQPDEVKVMILDDLNTIKPIAVVGEVANASSATPSAE